MKRTVFIIGGIAIILLLIGVWAYFLFFGTPSENGGTFANFNFGSTDDPSVVLPIDTDPTPTEPVVDVSTPDRLRQLTTSPAAGFQEVQLTPSSTPEIRYIEAGTGHIFSINLATGAEDRVSATTIPLANKGVMTPDGRYVMMQSGSGVGSEIIIGALSQGSDELQNFAIQGQITSFAATADNEFVYTTPSGNSLVALAYNPADNEVRDLFTIPFRDATVSWHHTTAGPHYVYPSATSRLEGFLYSYTDGVATREPVSGFGLSAVGSSAGIVYSKQVEKVYTSFTHNKDINDTDESALTLIPEKCAFATTLNNSGVCGIAFTDYSHLMPDQWYRGEVTMSDQIWEYDLNTQSFSLLSSPESTTGRQLDIININFGVDDNNFYFQNKTDGTLWTFNYNRFSNVIQ